MNLYNSLQSDDAAGYKEQMIKSVSTNIRNIRMKRNLTREHVAEAAKINAKYLGAVERGEKNPTALIIIRLSEALKVPICEILPMNNCPHINDDFFAKFKELSAGKKDCERQKAIKLLEVFFKKK